MKASTADRKQEAANSGHFVQFHRTVTTYDRVSAQWRQQLGLSSNERWVLNHLVHEGPLTASELSKRVNMTSAAMTTLVERMELAGYLTRRPDPADGRRTLLSTTDALADRGSAIARAVIDEFDQLVDQLPPEERDAVTRFMTNAEQFFARYAESR